MTVKTYESGAVRANVGKLRMDLLPFDALESVADVMTTALSDYEPRNWEKGFPWTSVFASLLRHSSKWMLGQDIDPKSGKPHMAHVACNAMFLLAYYLRKSGTDDRPRYDNQAKLDVALKFLRENEPHMPEYQRAPIKQKF